MDAGFSVDGSVGATYVDYVVDEEIGFVVEDGDLTASLRGDGVVVDDTGVSGQLVSDYPVGCC